MSGLSCKQSCRGISRVRRRQRASIFFTYLDDYKRVIHLLRAQLDYNTGAGTDSVAGCDPWLAFHARGKVLLTGWEPTAQTHFHRVIQQLAGVTAQHPNWPGNEEVNTNPGQWDWPCSVKQLSFCCDVFIHFLWHTTLLWGEVSFWKFCT